MTGYNYFAGIIVWNGLDREVLFAEWMPASYLSASKQANSSRRLSENRLLQSKIPTVIIHPESMAKVKLIEIAHGRSGDKGDDSNIGIIARHPDIYPFLRDNLTAARVKEHMKHICKGEVDRYELPNIEALNFVLHNSLGGGGTVSLKLDAQGKTHASMLLRMDIEVPDDLLEKVRQ